MGAHAITFVGKMDLESSIPEIDCLSSVEHLRDLLCYQYDAKYVLKHCAGTQEVSELSQNYVGTSLKSLRLRKLLD